MFQHRILLTCSGDLPAAWAFPAQWDSDAEPAGDDVALDLGSSGVDGARQGVADGALDFGVLHVAVAAEDLHRVERGLDEGFAREDLGDGGVQGDVARAVELPGRAVDEQARGFE